MTFFEFGKETIEDFGGGFGRLMNVVVAVVDDFGLDNGNEAGGLAFFGVFGEASAVFGDGVVGGGERSAGVVEVNFEGGAPFGEAQAHLIIFL